MSATIVVGLAFGDEGKGATTNFLVHSMKADLVVRYNGGAQAAHNVITDDGRHHTFCQFGSGTFVPNVKTHLSRFVLVNPLTMLNEETFLSKLGVTDALDRTSVDKKALIITPYQKALNRLMEMARGSGRHGSCGQGIGITRSHHLKYEDEVLFAGDISASHNSYQRVDNKLKFIQEICIDAFRHLQRGDTKVSAENQALWETEGRVLFNPGVRDRCHTDYGVWARRIKLVDSLGEVVSKFPIVFEGAQGVLLDEKHGLTPPYNTWTNTTADNALTLLKEIGYTDEVKTIGVLRSYFTRHGAGPFPSEDKALVVPEPHNKTEIYQENFRLGHFDMSLVLYALTLCKVNSLAINHLDIISKLPHILIHHYGDIMYMKSTDSFLKVLKEQTKLPISIEGYGPATSQRRMK